jgi:tight adherence protein B
MDLRLLIVGILFGAAALIVAYMLLQQYGDRLSEFFDDYRGKLDHRLRRTRNPFSNENFERMQSISTIGAGVLGLLLGDGIMGRIFLGALFAGLTWWGFGRYLDILWQRYVKNFAEQLPDMVSVIANAIKAGHSVQQALELVIEEFQDPMASEVGEVAQELRMGVAMDQAMRNWASRIQDDDLDIFASAVIIQRQTGGNLAEILENLAGTMRERKKIHGQIRTLTTQGRMSGLVMSFLPLGLYVALYLIVPERMGLMFTHPMGWALIALVAVLLTIGGLFIKRIVTIDV